MNICNIRAIDHARAAQIAVAVATDDDEMASLAITAAFTDDHPSSIVNVLIAMGVNVSQLLTATIGPDATLKLLRTTLAQLLEDGEDDA